MYDSPQNIKHEYQNVLREFDQEIKQVEQKAQRAMRVTLWIKIILSFASISAVGAWLKNHRMAETWALIIVLAEIADAMMDTLPYLQQRIQLPQLKIKLVDIMLEVERDYMLLCNDELTDKVALQRLYAHRNTWIKSLS